jgi:hypothetical protein
MASFVFIKGIATLDYATTVDIECTDKAQWSFGGKILCAHLLFTVDLVFFTEVSSSLGSLELD